MLLQRAASAHMEGWVLVLRIEFLLCWLYNKHIQWLMVIKNFQILALPKPDRTLSAPQARMKPNKIREQFMLIMMLSLSPFCPHLPFRHKIFLMSEKE